METFAAVLGECRGAHAGYDRAVEDVEQLAKEGGAGDAFTARIRAERMAVLLQARLLLEHTPGHVADAFIRSRLNPDALAYGGLRDPAAAQWLLGRLDLS
jgi:putative acyl-CoA dehydrogenase